MVKWSAMLWSGVDGQLSSSCCCGQGLVVSYCHIMLLWSGVGGSCWWSIAHTFFRRTLYQSFRENLHRVCSLRRIPCRDGGIDRPTEERYVKYLREMISGHLLEEAPLQRPREMQVTTLEGEPLTFDVFPTDTLKDFKAMLVARKHHEDLTERNLCCVKVLAGGLLVDDDQTLESAGLMCAGCDVMVMYTRREVEAATKEAIHEEDFLHVTIPSQFFELRENVLTMTIPESVTTIHQDAFVQCYNLARITLPESLTIVGPSAFWKCKSLASVTVPESVEFIGSDAFKMRGSLQNIALGGSLTLISSETFKECESLTSITIPASAGFFGAAAFKECAWLENISLCGPLTRISRATFQGCESLTHMAIPASVTFIGQGASLWKRSLWQSV